MGALRWKPAIAGILVCIFCQTASADFQVEPAAVSLSGNFSQTQLLVTATTNGNSSDLTAQAAYSSSNLVVCSVSRNGRISGKANGQAVITVTAGGMTKTVPVHVDGIRSDYAVDFQTQVMPILSKAGCNAGACHASQFGKGGFKLSVFGFAPEQDWAAIVRDSMSRRVNLVEPAESLVLLKPTLGVSHQGGKRFETHSSEYEILKQWLATGAPGPISTSPSVSGLTVHPRSCAGKGPFAQQLRVEARYSNGTVRDVTAWAKFDSMDDGLLQVDRDGLIRVIGKGQGSAMVRFEGQSEICTVVVPYASETTLAGWRDNDFIDKLAAAKFKEIGITPSKLCGDATFLRRAFFDAIGTLPTVAEAKAFLASADPDKRAKLIDQLLGLTGDPAQDVHNNDYAAFWALKWADLIRSNSQTIGEQGMWALNNWLKESFRANKPFDRFARELITAKGSTFSNGPANYYRVANNAQELTEATSQLFLGVRMQCAKCPITPLSRSARVIITACRRSSRGSAARGARSLASTAAKRSSSIYPAAK